MKAFLCSAALVLSAMASPVMAAPTQTVRTQTTLPPGCFQIYPNGPIFCVDMPIEP